VTTGAEKHRPVFAAFHRGGRRIHIGLQACAARENCRSKVPGVIIVSRLHSLNFTCMLAYAQPLVILLLRGACRSSVRT